MTCLDLGSIRTSLCVGRLVFYLPLLYITLCLIIPPATANVLLIGDDKILSFKDIEANFATSIKGSGESGTLYIAEPLDACSPLINKINTGRGVNASFALIIRGGCSFEEKVRIAQDAGFKAAIIYDNEDSGALVAMSGNPAGIRIHAVFISKASGETLKMYAGLPNMQLLLIPTFENAAWSIMVISFVSLLAMSIVLATCFFIRRRRVRREQSQAPCVREFHGMSNRLVKALPSLIFTSVLEDNCTSMTCAICLEDYSVGEKLRVLPCHHKFHAACVDSWLTTWRTFCPVCKRDARTSTGEPPASEHTPLLSSRAASSLGLSSAGSSFASSSSAIQIAIASSRTPSVSSHVHSHVGTPFPQSFRSYGNSPALTPSRSSVDLRNASSQRSCASHLASPHSLGYPSFSPLSSRYISPYVASSTNASPSYLGSSSRQPNMLHCSESAASFSPFASAQSLPGC
ncbi:receptor homology region, transmembrane domain- and RING domain-containing protein 2-like isoform X1 [Macadamia integrifolia]|uniref:receptor homology region, transmembrane domain- and RING domain-containing protein 2-like isoform X1 n=1 Tax=Macadamia integrifolia TaxID=60698 RepID=UPI001C5006EE|nr:receptor homology region, transmembrane domain- and RING domain-containing protein 2-like isoform X1 [Macadamia integrifolia]XP_042508456.1 receptor homology region, transmembrane domain- and RING domain-containing protein 2-like isoform X1 [Macadamia integrifolia]